MALPTLEVLDAEALAALVMAAGALAGYLGRLVYVLYARPPKARSRAAGSSPTRTAKPATSTPALKTHHALPASTRPKAETVFDFDLQG